MNESRVTIYDISKEAGASPATVSRVLNHSTYPVKTELREKILEVSNRLGYIPNMQARNLKRQTSTSLGVIIPSIDNPFYPSIVRGIEDEVVRHNYNMLVLSSDRNLRRANYSVDTLISMNIKGIISIYVDEIAEALSRFSSRGGLTINVTANREAIPGMHTVYVDKIAECKLAMNYLLTMGHKKIAILMDELNNSIRINRLEGYRQALVNAKLDADNSFVYIYGIDIEENINDTSKQKGYLLAKAMLKKTPNVTAFICMNDIMALGALIAMREAGRRIPADYSMVSFDDLFFADSIYPSLTTVGYDQYTWGRKLAKYYFKLLGENNRSNVVVKEKDVLSTSQLIVRQSSRQWF